MPAPTLAEIAEGLEADARRAQAEGQHDVAAKLALAAYAALRAWVAMGHQSLTLSPVTTRLRGDMEAAHRQKLSDARTGGEVHPMMRVARKHGLATMADLAEALGYTRSMMSRVLAGNRAISEGAAKRFKELTGKDWQ